MPPGLVSKITDRRIPSDEYARYTYFDPFERDPGRHSIRLDFRPFRRSEIHNLLFDSKLGYKVSFHGFR